jgi:hypothetical protein
LSGAALAAGAVAANLAARAAAAVGAVIAIDVVYNAAVVVVNKLLSMLLC